VATQRGFRKGLMGSHRRATSWLVGPQARDESVSITGLSLWTLGVLNLGEDVTVVRTRGLFSAFLRSATAVGDGFFGAVGIGIVTQKSFAIGSTAMPGPLTEVDWEGWLFHSFFDIRAVTATIADGVNAVKTVLQMEIDSKAMRKFEGDSTVSMFGMVEVVESGTSVMEYHAEVRQLWKLN